MKNSVRWLLIGSLVLNAALIVRVVGVSRLSEWLGRASPNANTATMANVVNVAPNSAPNTTWTQLSKGADPAELVKRLAAAGFPPEIVQAVVRGLVHREFAERRARLWRAVPFWKPADMNALYELDAQEQRRVQAIMGPDASNAPDEIAQRERLYGRIAPAKIAQIEKLARDYDEMVEKIGREGGGNLTEKEIAAFRLLREERQRDFAALLTPEELDDLEIRRSQASTAVMGAIGDLDLSEAEFRAMVRVEDKFLGQVDPLTGHGAGMPQQVFAAENAKLAALRTTLGAENFERYIGAIDPRYRVASGFVRDAGLAPQTAVKLWELEREGASRRGAIFWKEHDGSVQTTDTVEALREEMRRRMIELLGKENWEAYRRRGGASW